MKHFLFITYYFPPAGGPAVQRIIKIIQYMAKNGWQCIVLTVKNGEYTNLDPELEDEIPSQTKVVRTAIFEPYKFYRKFIGKKDDEKIPLAVLSSHPKAGWKEKIANTIRANLFIPDARIGWYFYGVKAGIQAIKKNQNIQLVFSSGPPHTVHLIARSISKKTGIPFITDFRDPWLNIDYYHGINRSRLTLALDKYLERKILSTANAVTVVSPGCQDLLANHHKHIKQTNFRTVFNGFDADVYPKKFPIPKNDKFKITYIGNLPLTRFTPHFYEAISQLKQENKIDVNHFQLNFYGNIDAAVRTELSKFQIDNLLQFHGFVPHREAILKICESHLLLLIINNTHTRKAIVTGKLFEYLGSRRPIFCIGPVEGDAAKILQETKGGVVFDYQDIIGIKNYLLDRYQNWKNRNWKPIKNNELEKYDRFEQLKKLAVLFETFVI